MGHGITRLDRMLAGEQLRAPCGEFLELPVPDGYETGRTWYDWEIDRRLLNSRGFLFGGHIAALADDMACYTALTVLPDGSSAVTSDLRVSYFRPVHPDDGTLHMEGRVVNQSRSNCHVECELTRKSDGKLIAKASAIVTPGAPPTA
ncbi:MAG TPA: PaaI family thioesterase [Caulobacteraceae bacterium]|jgi:uncharacterized protein (TIGR00369 family)